MNPAFDGPGTAGPLDPPADAAVAPDMLWVDLTPRSCDPGLSARAARTCRAVTTTSWDAALRFLRTAPPASLCVEFDRPEPADLERLGEIARTHPALPILMLTEFHSEALAVRALRMHVWDYLVKPVDPGELETKLGSLLASAGRPRDCRASTTGTPTLSSRSRTGRAVSYIAENFSDRIDLATAARLCSLSPSQFSRVFKREHGVTFSAFLVRYRIGRACELLSRPRSSVKEVSFGVGFRDLSYFSRTFRRCVGRCPTEYQSEASAFGLGRVAG